MSGDSRTTATKTEQVTDPKDPAKQSTVTTNLVLSDSTDKLFLLHDRIGVGITGDAFIKDLPVAHYIDTFQPNAKPLTNVQNLANDLLTHFSSLQPTPNVALFVGGYDSTTPSVFVVDVAKNKLERMNIDPATENIVYGILTGGDREVADRLLSNPKLVPPFHVMNLQDGVDYSRHLIRATIDQLRFEPRFPTVGGPIDTIVVTSSGGTFLARKSLHPT